MPRYLFTKNHEPIGIVCAHTCQEAMLMTASRWPEPGKCQLIEEAALNEVQRLYFNGLIDADCDLRNNGEQGVVIGDVDDIVIDPDELPGIR